MGEVSDFLKSLAPVPWIAALDDDGERWGLTVLAADGMNLAHRPMYREEARYLAAVNAIAPEALMYVEEAAAKGGSSAKAILDRFKYMATQDLTPEQMVSARRPKREGGGT